MCVAHSFARLLESSPARLAAGGLAHSLGDETEPRIGAQPRKERAPPQPEPVDQLALPVGDLDGFEGDLVVPLGDRHLGEERR